eukprot:TRINITY_DN13830_c0_g3_i3.p1 TRINITY_DN13830_c0_g3~~TRINITY_DN13830_c0_g3_i3.p1  ORF type:complete len:104 (+),score=7.38 TRINITY_DN13830_c0_g3_i3:58-369(+)
MRHPNCQQPCLHMGLICSSCNRKNSEADETTKDPNHDQRKYEALYEYLEKQRLQYLSKRPGLRKVSRLTGILNSASQYWQHTDKMTLTGNHRPVISYLSLIHI